MAKRKNKTKKVIEVITPKRKRSRGSKPKRQSRRSKMLANANHVGKLTPAGRTFLQAAIASRDFPGVKGPIPDASVGASVVIRSRLTKTFTASANSPDYTLVLLPTPGVACWQSPTSASTSVSYRPVVFGDFGSLFGTTPGGTSVLANVDAFRYVAKTFEIKPVSATLNNSGLILAARCPNITLTSAISGTFPQPPVQALGGLSKATQGNLSAMPAVFQGHINQGVYGFAIQNQPQWPWTSIQVDVDGTNIPYAEDTSKAALEISDTLPEWVGFGTMGPIVISISGLTAGTSFALTVEDIVEYRPAVGSLLAEMASPGHAIRDQVAMDFYEIAAESMQPFCPADQNDGFWEKFLNVIAMTAGSVAPFTGQYAPLVGAVGGVATGLRSLIL